MTNAQTGGDQAARPPRFDATDIVLAVALGLLAIGCGLVWLPGAFIAPGLVGLWLTLPSRAPFVSRPLKPLPRPDQARQGRGPR